MISNQETFNLSPYIAIYDIVVPQDNMLRQIKEKELIRSKSNELAPFSFSKPL